MAFNSNITEFATMPEKLTPEEEQRIAEINAGVLTLPTVVEESRDNEQEIDDSNSTTLDQESNVSTEPTSGPFVVNVDQGFPTQKPFENPLHNYASYTYSLSLHMITIDTYNEIINNNFVNEAPRPYVPENVLISSAGRYNDTDFKRNEYWKEDFYFEDFKMQTVITPNMRNRNTNVIECSFTIIEPNGFTLINRMIEAANKINKNYVAAPESYARIPYVLQIDFFGYKETGDSKPEKISELTKIIPITLINIETQVRQSGAEYKVEAVAFNHQIFSQINNSIPFNTTVQASTVYEAFNAGDVSDSIQTTFKNNLAGIEETQREISRLRQFREQLVNTSQEFIVDVSGDLQDVDTRLSQLQSDYQDYKNTSISANGLCNSFNAYFQALKTRGDITYAPTYRVEFDPEIAKSKLFSGPQPTSVTEAGTASKSTKANSKTSLIYDSGVINIPAGTTIDKVIDYVVRQSDYVLKQIVLPTQEGTVSAQQGIRDGKRIEDIVNTLNAPLKWFKIVPTLKVGKWDDKLKRFSADIIVFYVKTFTISSKYPYGPRGRVPGYVKKYDYLFTGRNRDVMDWNINFNLLYALAVTGGLNKTIQGTTATGLNPAGAAATPDIKTGTGAALPPPADPVAAPGIAVTAGTAENIVIQGGNIQKATAAADLAKSLLLDSRGDMIELELKILGDPHFIKQDDMFYSRPKQGQSSALTPNNSLYMDTGELYVFVNFISPVDYDEEKGLAEIKANEILGSDTIEARSVGYSNFSGVYKLITVDNVFARGKFEQTLRMAKVFNDQLGKTFSSYREEQQKLKITVASAYTAGTRFSTGGATEFASDVNATSAFLQNNTGIDIAGRIVDLARNAAITVAGRIVGDVVDRGIASIRESLGQIPEGISISDQPLILTTVDTSPEIINVDWGGGINALG